MHDCPRVRIQDIICGEDATNIDILNFIPFLGSNEKGTTHSIIG
jgi:hypothetical protein